MGAGLDVDLRHHSVLLHARDEPHESVACAGEDIRGVCGGVGECDRTGGERIAGDLDRRGPRRRKDALIDPPTEGVVAHAEQTRGLGDTV
ncbi:hypothetical protein Mlaev_01154 [Microbacterium laevaniformans]|uniref:Uncharacterized protein n=1 Tax=Microbacterium laevaniformans TaxID=36807 RepID=A0A150HFL1_9MICO|nr:hypothetical protein Mlaev_01154 [Microbacterium laevaniformans]